MIRLTYVSIAKDDISPADINAIETTAIRENAKRGVTGILLFNGRNFMQVLEGAPGDVIETYARLHGDARHSGLIQIMYAAIESRAFPDWSMRVSLVRSAMGDVNLLTQRHATLEAALPAAVPESVRTMLLSFNALA